MFVPSESVYAELHDGFDDLMQKAYRAQVVLVSPSLLMLAIQVMQQIQKDARMREAAARDPHRGRPSDERPRPAARARAATCRSISGRRTRTWRRSSSRPTRSRAAAGASNCSNSATTSPRKPAWSSRRRSAGKPQRPSDCSRTIDGTGSDKIMRKGAVNLALTSA